MPDRALRNNRSIWGEPGNESHSVEYGDEAVDLEFIRGLPADSVFELSLSDVVPASFAAVAHLAPGLRGLGLFLDDLGDDAPSVIAELTALEYLALLGGPCTEHGLPQLRRLPQLRHLHIERENLTAPMFRFAAAMPALTRPTGLDEFGDEGPDAPGRGRPGPGHAPAHQHGLTSPPSLAPGPASHATRSRISGHSGAH